MYPKSTAPSSSDLFFGGLSTLNPQPLQKQHYVDTHWKAQYKDWQKGTCRACKAWMDTMTRTVLSNLARGLPLGQAGGMSNGLVSHAQILRSAL